MKRDLQDWRNTVEIDEEKNIIIKTTKLCRREDEEVF